MMDEQKAQKHKSSPNTLLRAERERQSLTLHNVAEAVEAPDPHMVGRWERGEVQPSPHYIRKLCGFFQKSPEELGLDKRTLAKSRQDRKAEPPGKAPSFFTSFIGRQQEVEQISALLKRSDVRLVTLTGAGGIGKTRLGVQVAEGMHDFFVDGVYFVPLETVTDMALVLPTIARALDISESESRPIHEQVKSALRDKHALLLLDNFEQVADAAPIIEDLLIFCPHLKALITSRVVLHLQAEHHFPILPLPLISSQRQLPPIKQLLDIASIALFVECAQRAQPGFALTLDNAQDVITICMQLDGLPLAIELASARIKLLTPQDLLGQLKGGLHILQSNLHGIAERHRTIQGAMTWSYNLLQEPEQRLFRRLAIFKGGCTLEAIRTLFAHPQAATVDLLNSITSLIDNSLLQQATQNNGESRFLMLETVREYALDALRERGEFDECQRAHAFYYLQFVGAASPHLKGEQQITWLGRLERELNNANAALEWFVARKDTEHALHLCEVLGKFYGLKGYWSEEQRWLDTTLALPQTPESMMMRARVLRRAGHLAYRMRMLDKAHELYTESIALSQSVGDKENLAGALSGLAGVCYRHREIEQASQLLQQSVVAARESGNAWALANVLESQGRFLYNRGNTAGAYPLVEESLSIARKLQDRECIARILTTFVSIKLSQGAVEQAAMLAQECSELAQTLGTKPLNALVLDRLGKFAMLQGNYDQAIQLFEERMIIAHDLGDRPTIAKKQLYLGDIALAQGDLKQAKELVEKSLQFFREQGDAPDIAAALNVLGNIALAGHDCTLATNCYREALQLDREVGSSRNIGWHLVGLAKVALAQKQAEQAAQLFGFIERWSQPDADLHPAQRESYRQALQSARKLLEEAHFTRAYSAGSTMTLEQVLASLT